MKKLVLILALILIPQIAHAGACAKIITAQENAVTQAAQAQSLGAIQAMANTQAQQGQQANKSQGCFANLSKMGAMMSFPTTGGLLNQIESMACSMSSGLVMSSVSTLSSPLSAYSSYGISASPGFGQSGITTTPSGPPPVLTSTTSSLMGTATGGASSIFGNVGSSITNSTNAMPGANSGALPGTNRASTGISNSFNNIYK